MKTISTGNIFKIYDDTLETYNQLPVGTYFVRFDKMTGFYLEKNSNIEIKEGKIYGVHLKKVEKVLKAFKQVNRNLGVILSGNKGIGKSLFAKLLSVEAMKKGLPLILVDRFIPGIASFIEQIDQEVIVLFDEFDKTFGNIRTSDNEADPQAGLLSLFDGISTGKKLFVITCNEIRSLNDYLINRPGRFHYHFRFNYPSPSEVEEYLKDKLEEKYYSEISKVVLFSKKINLNYDCLRAISFELNNGEKFETAILDLNIVNTNAIRYNVALHFKDSIVTMKALNQYIDLFNKDEDEYIELSDSSDREIVSVSFNSSNCVFDTSKGATIVYPHNLKLTYDEDYDNEIVEKAKKLIPDYLSIERCKEKDLHFMV
ncbi:AAA family ATPase [Lacrimispora amygdalina]|uniref:AAA family ATPase n=1 Tax=Lacrimispora amygdalina TaxID=253257 RepID=UPI000BE4667C|nr:AAA family ATPase [Lacrimispora amygdalina]